MSLERAFRRTCACVLPASSNFLAHWHGRGKWVKSYSQYTCRIVDALSGGLKEEDMHEEDQTANRLGRDCRVTELETQ